MLQVSPPVRTLRLRQCVAGGAVGVSVRCGSVESSPSNGMTEQEREAKVHRYAPRSATGTCLSRRELRLMRARSRQEPASTPERTQRMLAAVWMMMMPWYLEKTEPALDLRGLILTARSTKQPSLSLRAEPREACSAWQSPFLSAREADPACHPGRQAGSQRRSAIEAGAQRGCPGPFAAEHGAQAPMPDHHTQSPGPFAAGRVMLVARSMPEVVTAMSRQCNE
jgi:hypothetical protein